MSLLVDYSNFNKKEDSAFWYIWASDFAQTFKYLLAGSEYLLRRRNINIDKLPPQPGHISMWIIYFTAIELYLKAFLLAKKKLSVEYFEKREYSHHLEKLLNVCREVDDEEKVNRFNDEDLNQIISILRYVLKNEKKENRDDWTKIRYPGKTLGMYGRKTMLPPLYLLENIVKPLVWVKD